MKCKRVIPGVAIVCLGSGIMATAFFAPWCVIAIESVIIVAGGVILIISK